MLKNLKSLIILIKITIKNIRNLNEILSQNYVLSTASDEQHFLYLKNLIKNIYKNDKVFYKTIVYDIGLNSQQLLYLQKYEKIEVRKFPFANYPEFFKKRIEEHKNKIGGFAWKPAIINILSDEFNENIIWFDSANLFNKKIVFFKILLYEYGFASFISSGRIKDWTYESVLIDLKIENNKKILYSKNLMGGVVGVNPKNYNSRALITRWLDLAIVESNIFPEGSSIHNHRHDQSLLSISFYEKSNFILPETTNLFGISVQNWKNKILFFYDDRKNIRKELLKQFYNFSTTTNSRCKIIILFNASSVDKIPLYLFFNKKVLLFIFDETDLLLLKNFSIKNKLLKIFINNKIKNNKLNRKNIFYIDYNFINIKNIIQYNFDEENIE